MLAGRRGSSNSTRRTTLVGTFTEPASGSTATIMGAASSIRIVPGFRTSPSVGSWTVSSARAPESAMAAVNVIGTPNGNPSKANRPAVSVSSNC